MPRRRSAADALADLSRAAEFADRMCALVDEYRSSGKSATTKVRKPRKARRPVTAPLDDEDDDQE